MLKCLVISGFANVLRCLYAVGSVDFCICTVQFSVLNIYILLIFVVFKQLAQFNVCS